MDLLKWRQDANGVNVETPCDGVLAHFVIENSLIRHLLACTPRLYIVFVQNKQGNEIQYVLDLTDIKPVINKNNALKLTIGRPLKRTSSVGGNICGRYCVARGESYHERFLTDKGWQSQRSYFDLYTQNAVANQDTNVQVKERVQLLSNVETKVSSANVSEEQNVVQQPEKAKGKLALCKFCGEIYPSSMVVCPYCQNKGKNAEQDNEVDISI